MSASVSSKIPLAKHRLLSPERSPADISPSRTPTRVASKLPVKVSPTKSCDYSIESQNLSDLVASPSRIPVLKNSGECLNEPQRKTSQPRPQSIDLEDEYGRSFVRFPSPEKFHHSHARKISDPKIGGSVQPQRKISPQVSPSKIPISTEYYVNPDRPRPSPPRSSSSSSLKVTPDREIVDQSMTRTKSSDFIADNIDLEDNVLEYSLPKPRRQSAPASQRSQIPVIGWSLVPERQEQFSPKNNDAENNHSTNIRRVSAPPVPFSEVNLADGRGRKRFEAFVMTGDRMINLAKTPAHQDFRSKYYRGPSIQASGDSILKSPKFDVDDELPDSTSVDDLKSVKLRGNSVQRRSLARNSKSEDQLQMDALEYDDMDENISSSVHLLHNGDNPSPSAIDSDEKSPYRTRTKSPPKNLFHETSMTSSQISNMTASQTSNQSQHVISSQTSASPDLSTSSLISCSEHYNGGSVLDNISPKSQSSLETEWSLIDSFHRARNESSKKSNSKLSPTAEATTPVVPEYSEGTEDITSSGNRVVISINNNNNHSLKLGLEPEESRQISTSGSKTSVSPGADSSSGTLTPEARNSQYSSQQHHSDEEDFDEDRSLPENLGSSSQGGSESEESDMESLRSFHPPVRVVDLPSAVRLARRLYNLEGFRKPDVSRHLCKNNDFTQVVAEEYLKLFTFNDLSLDGALRQFLSRFCLAGETQERERVLLHFARRYVACNPSVVGLPNSWFRSLDAVHTLTCAIMLLNTDLHGENLQRRMTCAEFIENLSDLNDGQNFPKELLKQIYYSIKQDTIPWTPEQEEESLPAEPATVTPPKPARANLPIATAAERSAELEASQAGVMASQVAIGKSAGGYNPFLSAPDQETAVNYKKGYVMRKACVDPNGKKTKLGKRSWKMFFMVLRDMVLYCFKDEKTIRAPGSFDDLSQAIRIHHSLATRADHRKKQFVFRLFTADQAQYLFQTSDEKELLIWIDSINAVVASFSAPQLPAPCSSSYARFQRPLMPSSKSSLTFHDQLLAHERQLMTVREELDDHLKSPPGKGAKGAGQQAYKEKEEFLTFEVMRYETYILTLRTKNSHDV